MIYKTKRNIAILLPIVVFSLLGMVLFACGTSNEQERQITNAFTPGQSAQGATPQTQQTVDFQSQTDATVITPESQSGTPPLPFDQPTMMITNTQGLPIIVTQTRPSVLPNQPTPSRTLTKKPTDPATATPSKTPTPTNPLVPTLPTGWAGEWKVYVGEGTGPYKSAVGSISLDGLLAQGIFALDEKEFSFIADLSKDQQSLNGSYQWGAAKGWLAWFLDSNLMQFRGTLDNTFVFCAARNGMPMPNPCGRFVPY